MQTIVDIRNHFIDELNIENFNIDRLGSKTIELIGASFLADGPAIFGEPNQEYIDAEIEWYMKMSTNIHDIYEDGFDPPRAWKYAADPHGNINSNYGKLIFDDKFYQQYGSVLEELESNPDTRRACMVYNRPSIWTEYNEGGKDDFICTNAVTYYLRDRVNPAEEEYDITYLDCVVQMRSNDVIFGYRNDYAWQQYILSELSDDLGQFVIPGDMIWQVQNLHVYEKHFHLVHEAAGLELESISYG